MSGDELILFWGSGLVAVILGARWYWPWLRSRQRLRAQSAFWLLFWIPPLALAGVFVALRRAASYDVRDSADYLFLYSVLGAAWFFAAVQVLSYLNISYRDDAVERRNPAAVIAVTSVLFAHAAIYAAANIGDGPGWWCVVMAAGLGSSAWFLLWWVAENVCHQSEAVTVDRDVPAAIRFSGYGLAMALVCARGAAGDWTSFFQTIAEFHVAWPILPLTLSVVVIELILSKAGPTPRRNLPLALILAALYLGGAVFVVVQAGPLPQNSLYGGLVVPSP